MAQHTHSTIYSARAAARALDIPVNEVCDLARELNMPRAGQSTFSIDLQGLVNIAERHAEKAKAQLAEAQTKVVVNLQQAARLGPLIAANGYGTAAAKLAQVDRILAGHVPNAPGPNSAPGAWNKYRNSATAFARTPHLAEASKLVTEAVNLLK
jgi:hypothetical protein